MYLKTLIWKDFRNQQRFLIAAGVFLILPHLIAAGVLIANQFGAHAVEGEKWTSFFWAASIADLGIAALLTAFFAGNAIAGERADRSAEFSAYLPIPRKDAVTSKAIVALGISVSLLVLCAGAALFFNSLGRLNLRSPGPLPPTGPFLGIVAMAFGTAWLASSLARSATYAAAVGVVVPICIWVTLWILSELETMAHVDMGRVFFVICLLIGPASFVAGIVCYMRRVEP